MNFTSSKETRWQTAQVPHQRAVCDKYWEAEFCRVAEAHPSVRVYVKNQNLGLEVGRANYLPMTYSTDWREYTMRMLDRLSAIGACFTSNVIFNLPPGLDNPLRVPQHR